MDEFLSERLVIEGWNDGRVGNGVVCEVLHWRASDKSDLLVVLAVLNIKYLPSGAAALARLMLAKAAAAARNLMEENIIVFGIGFWVVSIVNNFDFVSTRLFLNDAKGPRTV